MPKTIIWDFNGTILDDVKLCWEIEMKMLSKRNMKSDYSLDEYRQMFCFPVISFYKKLGYTFRNESYKDVSDEFNRYYDECYQSCSLVDGVLEKIQESNHLGYQNVIVSATLQKTLEEQISWFGLSAYFDALIGIDDNMAYSKIEHAKEWMNISQINPALCKMIGDSQHDAETARALGIDDIVLVACGHQSADILKTEQVTVKMNMKEVIL